MCGTCRILHLSISICQNKCKPVHRGAIQGKWLRSGHFELLTPSKIIWLFNRRSGPPHHAGHRERRASAQAHPAARTSSHGSPHLAVLTRVEQSWGKWGGGSSPLAEQSTTSADAFSLLWPAYSRSYVFA